MGGTTEVRLDSAPELARDRIGRGQGVSLVVVALLLQLFAWSSLDGYPIADVIEYVDLAEQLVEEGGLDPTPRRFRSPLYPLLLAPIFLLRDAFDLGDSRWVMPLARAVQLAFGCAFVLVAARLGALVATRRAGWVAGLVVATNPIFLFHCVDPLADVPAGVLLALGLERLLAARAGRSSGLVTGLLLGSAVLVSYKVLPVVAALLLGTALSGRERRAERPEWRGIAAGLGIALALELVLDRLVYGVWGLSLVNYLIYNVGVVLVNVLSRLGLDGLAAPIWNAGGRHLGFEPHADAGVIADRVGQHVSPFWYLENATEFVVWPVLLLALVAGLDWLRRPSRAVGVVLFALAVDWVVLGNKEGKAYRLWLPALPLVAALVARGWSALEGARRSYGGVLATALVALGAIAGVLEFRSAELRSHGHYWRAMAWLNEAAASSDAPRPNKVGATYFAVAYRDSADVELVPFVLPPAWVAALGSGREHEERAMRAYVEELDWIVASRALLWSHASVLAAINDLFSVEAAFWSEENNPAAGPVYVLRRSQPGDGRRFASCAQPGRVEPGSVRLESLPGDGLGWLTVSSDVSTAGGATRLRAESRAGELLHEGTARDVIGAPVLPARSGGVLVDGLLFPLTSEELHRRGLRVLAVEDGTEQELARFSSL